MIDPKVNIQENDILELSPELLNTLLKDHTVRTEDKQVNIFWATDNLPEVKTWRDYVNENRMEITCGEASYLVDRFGETEHINNCEGCKTGDIRKHNGTYVLIKDWGDPKAKQKSRYIYLMK